MITSGDIEEILYKDLKKFKFKQYRKDAIKDGKVDSERLIVLCGTLEEDVFWSRAFVNINVCVPDFKGMANTKRLTEIERMLCNISSVSKYDESTYRYEVRATSQEEDPDLKCHFVNIRVLFEVLNIK